MNKKQKEGINPLPFISEHSTAYQWREDANMSKTRTNNTTKNIEIAKQAFRKYWANQSAMWETGYIGIDELIDFIDTDCTLYYTGALQRDELIDELEKVLIELDG